MTIDKNLYLLLILLLPFSLFAEDQYRPYFDSRSAFFLEYPAELIAVPAPQSEVVLALRSEKGFPTFNIIMQPGQLLVLPGKSLCEQLVVEYHGVGLTDTRLIGNENLPGSAPPVQICRLEYTRQHQLMYAWVAVMQQRDSHFVLTLLDQQSELKPAYRHLFSSFRLETSGGLQTSPASESSALWLALILSLLIICLVIFLLRSKRRA